jgi:hypothetical protein
MTAFFLSTEDGATPPTPETPAKPKTQIPLLLLESMDGTLQIPLDGTTGWIRMPGATGLEMPPYEVVTEYLPGVPGGMQTDVRVEPRSIFVPIYCSGDDNHLSYLSKMNLLRRVVDPTRGAGTFKLVGKTELGERELIVTYVSGLEGLDDAAAQGLTWAKFGLQMVAHQPFARAREDRSLEFRMASTDTPFIGVAGGTDAPFPTMLASGSVIGSGMTVSINSDVPVYPNLTLVGPMNSFLGTLSPAVLDPEGGITSLTDNTWNVDIPAGVPGGQTLTMVTDPRTRSIRLDGALAAGRVALGSTLRPFYRGQNTLTVVAPGGTDATRIFLSWRELYRSLW